MIKFTDASVVFEEIPGKVTLAVNISNCQRRCEGCHSSYLRDDIGKDLEPVLPSLLQKYGAYIECVCFLGEGNDPEALARCIRLVRQSGLEVALYSGALTYDDIPVCKIVGRRGLDYLKIGPYFEELGPLNNPKTNQRLYQTKGDWLLDITNKFWRDLK